VARDELEVLIAQLLACRAQLDATLVYLGAIETGPAAPADVCTHPESQRKYLLGTMGSPRRFTCEGCQETVMETAPPGAGA
jgi:hypothetical protein